MDLQAICQYIQDSSVGTSIRESLITFPVIEGIHVLGLALSVGVIFMVDLRLIGVRMKSESLTAMLKALEPWSMVGFVAMFITGALLFWAEAARLYRSDTFKYKLIFLALTGVNAMLFHKTLSKNATEWERDPAGTPTRARIAGWMGIILWTGVVGFGRWTAYGLK